MLGIWITDFQIDLWSSIISLFNQIFSCSGEIEDTLGSGFSFGFPYLLTSHLTGKSNRINSFETVGNNSLDILDISRAYQIKKGERGRRNFVYLRKFITLLTCEIAQMLFDTKRK